MRARRRVAPRALEYNRGTFFRVRRDLPVARPSRSIAKSTSRERRTNGSGRLSPVTEKYPRGSPAILNEKPLAVRTSSV